ncbi:MAG TPA: hypothetical protein VGF16_14270 [Bryobacteraceae bacterium]|jgi:hypothetical protein
MLIVLCPACNRFSQDAYRCGACGAHIGEIVTELLIPYESEPEPEPEYALAGER